MKRNDWKRLLGAAALVMIDGFAMVLFQRYPSFFFPAYRFFSKQWIALLAWLTSFSSAAVWDIALPLFVLASLVCLVQMIRKKKFLTWFTSVLLILSILLSEVILGWMLNHYAPKLAEELGYEVTLYDSEELYDACEYFLKKASEYALLMERQEDGHLAGMDFYDLAESAGRIYEPLEEENPVLSGSHVRVKKLSVVGEYLMYNGIIGMFMPISGEAGVPASVPSAPMPFTMAHEAAHRLGIASEEEANFAAFLGCVNSDDIRFLYSGYYSAFSYCFSSLYSVNPKKCTELIEACAETEGLSLLLLDRRETAEIYDSYESPLHEVSDQINDTYLKTFSEESGIRSYGEVTDDLIAWFQKREK